MVDQNEKDAARHNDPESDSNPRRRTSISSRNPTNMLPYGSDDVIVSLADAYENKRARQVTEWEQMHQDAGQIGA
jgi:hypothetical protein